MTEQIWRKVHRRDSYYAESASMHAGKSFSWSKTSVHRITLECGHVTVRRGTDRPPQTKALCKRCMAGDPVKSVENIEPGVFDKRTNEIKNPIARGVLEAAQRKAAEH